MGRDGRDSEEGGTTLLPMGGRGEALQNTGGLPAGTKVGAYTVGPLIARGGFGAVYEATDATGAPVALKMLHKSRLSPEIIERFHREVHVLEQLKHPNIVRFIELGLDDDGVPFYTMELLKGESLRSRCKGRRMSPEETLTYLEPLVAALSTAHALGVIHRDLKASNILVTQEEDGSERVVLLDFGIAKLREEEQTSLTTSRHAVGTPSAMAPEQVGRGNITAQTDVYGLGTLVFRMLTGRSPFDEKSALLLKHLQLNAKTPRPSEYAQVPAKIDACVVKSMSKAQEDRQASVDEFLEEYRAALSTELTPPPKPRPESEAEAAFAVYLRVSVEGDDPDDDALDDMEAVIDIGKEVLLGEEYQEFLETDDALLVCRPLAGSESDAVWKLVRALRSRESASPHVKFTICVEAVDGAMTGGRVTKEERVTSLTSWSVDEPNNSVIGTERASQVLKADAQPLEGSEEFFILQARG